MGSTLNKTVLLLTFMAFVFFSVGMSPRQPDPFPIWNFEASGIYIECNADRMLNFFNDKPHTMIMVVYQLTTTDAFNVAANTGEGLKKLLQQERFDNSVVAINAIIVQPGEKRTKVFDRVENVQWVGVVAGYYDLVPGQANQTFRIPVIYSKKGRIRIRKTVAIGKLHITLNLGPKTILKAGTVNETK